MPRRKAVSLYDLSRGKKKTVHTVKSTGGISISFSLFRGGNTCNYSKISPSLSDVKV